MDIDTVELTPIHFYRFLKHDEETQYDIKDGVLRWRRKPVKGAQIESFRFYRNGFAKDRNHCYHLGRRLAGGNGSTFRSLNFCYVTDGVFVWTVGGKVKDADASTFAVCDDGFQDVGGGVRSAKGYAKDRNRVYYFSGYGKPNWIRKASPDSFVSLNLGYYGKDANHVFYERFTIARADVASWRMIGSDYSCDRKRVYYSGREIAGADSDSFEVVPTRWGYTRLVRDRNRYYALHTPIQADRFAELMSDAKPIVERIEQARNRD